MPVILAGKKITTVGIIEDDDSNRDSLAEIVADANFRPVPRDEPLPSLADFAATAARTTDAFIFDHHLKQSQYAPFDGAEAVAALYKKRPSLLCTQWSKADIDTIRLHRRRIPVLIPTDDMNPERITQGIEVCIKEFKDEFLPSREPVRTIVRIEDVDSKQNPPTVYGILPSWNPRQVVRFPIDVIDEKLRKYVRADERFFVHVNLGAEDEAELYLDDFEYRGRLK